MRQCVDVPDAAVLMVINNYKFHKQEMSIRGSPLLRSERSQPPNPFI